MQQHPLLQTKLNTPPIRPKLVSRPRLIGRLNEGLYRKLTLVSAPAGFGKTTLVSEWVAGCKRPAAWLSLDEGDNDATRFLAYLVAAFQTIVASLGEAVLGLLHSPEPPPTESILTALLNEIATIPHNTVLVLDDYHIVDAKAVNDALAFLLEHLSPQIHLVIATREDPNLPLARLRVRNQLTEVRVADLRFTNSEAVEFLNQVMGLNLLAEEIASLETRTEGWIAGLQLAALSMREREDVSGFITAFAVRAAILGLAYWASGDLDAAHRSVADGISNMLMADNLLFAISGTPVLADIRIAQGRLHEAAGAYRQSLQLATEQGEPVLQGTADLHLGLSEIHHQQGDVETATQHLLRSEELGEQAGLPRWQYRWCIAKAGMKEAQGDLDAALDLLHEAERLHYRHIIPEVRPVAALKTRVWVAQGRLTEAMGWVRERGLSIDDDLSYLREFEHLTLARVLIARYRSDRVDGSIHEAVDLLGRLLNEAEEGKRVGSVIQILVLQALAHEAQGDIPGALAPLERALTLAEPEGYVRMFVDEGPPLAALLTKRMKDEGGRMKAYTHKLLASCGNQKVVRPSSLIPHPSSFVPHPSSFILHPLIEPLSERELEVLRLLGTELNGPEIACELVVSLATIRTHTQNIYGKLGVNNRRAAVRRAEELDLL